MRSTFLMLTVAASAMGQGSAYDGPRAGKFQEPWHHSHLDPVDLSWEKELFPYTPRHQPLLQTMFSDWWNHSRHHLRRKWHRGHRRLETAPETTSAALSYLERGLSSSAVTVRAAAALSICRAAGAPLSKRVWDSLRRTLTSENPVARQQACLALGCRPDRASTRILVEILKSPFTDAPSPSVALDVSETALMVSLLVPRLDEDSEQLSKLVVRHLFREGHPRTQLCAAYGIGMAHASNRERLSSLISGKRGLPRAQLSRCVLGLSPSHLLTARPDSATRFLRSASPHVKVQALISIAHNQSIPGELDYLQIVRQASGALCQKVRLFGMLCLGKVRNDRVEKDLRRWVEKPFSNVHTQFATIALAEAAAGGRVSRIETERLLRKRIRDADREEGARAALVGLECLGLHHDWSHGLFRLKAAGPTLKDLALFTSPDDLKSIDRLLAAMGGIDQIRTDKLVRSYFHCVAALDTAAAISRLKSWTILTKLSMSEKRSAIYGICDSGNSEHLLPYLMNDFGAIAEKPDTARIALAMTCVGSILAGRAESFPLRLAAVTSPFTKAESVYRVLQLY